MSSYPKKEGLNFVHFKPTNYTATSCTIFLEVKTASPCRISHFSAKTSTTTIKSLIGSIANTTNIIRRSSICYTTRPTRCARELCIIGCSTKQIGILCKWNQIATSDCAAWASVAIIEKGAVDNFDRIVITTANVNCSYITSGCNIGNEEGIGNC
jgi:hypothetical protein